ncbi:MAG: GNAT family N-acetyltransferase [Nitrososphaerota archaeon]|nr:GNAT family N-acetyltransferase [Nitrososphaerota archaeon]
MTKRRGDPSPSSAKVTVRRATASHLDSNVFYEARNDPVSRRFSTRTAPIKLAAHEEWYADALKDKSKRLYIIELRGRPVGYCRVEGPKNEISIALLPKDRGVGIASAALKIVRRKSGGKTLTAVMMAENIASKSAFAKAGFTSMSAEGGWETWSA